MSEPNPHREPGDSRTRPKLPWSDAFVRGVRLGTPIFLGYVPVGAAFGILATSLAKTTVQDKAVIEATSKAAK